MQKKFRIANKGNLKEIYVDILDKLPKSIQISQFADDIAIYSKYSPFKKCRNVIERAVNTIKNNLRNLGLELAPDKIVLVNFNNLNIKPGTTEMSIDNCVIKSSESARFLRVTFDYKLSFSLHISQVIQRYTRSLNIVKYVCGAWGADPNTLIVFYKNFVRSILDYACFVYFPTQKTIIEKLEKIQFSALTF